MVFGFLILIHELGHYITARIFKVTINEFSIGMGPRVLSRVSKKTGIRYSLAAFPLGGFVAMAGEADESDDPNSFDRKSWWIKFFNNINDFITIKFNLIIYIIIKFNHIF